MIAFNFATRVLGNINIPHVVWTFAEQWFQNLSYMYIHVCKISISLESNKTN